MVDYFKPIDHILNEVSFEYLGGQYKGPGILKWRPETGFQLEAFLKREGELPKKVEFQGVSIMKSADFQTIRMRLWPSGLAIAPDVPLSHMLGPFDLIAHGWLSINLNQVLFFGSTSISKPGSWIGSALYRTDGISRLFEPITSKTFLDDYEIRSSHSFSGIRVEEEIRTINGIVGDDKKRLELHWSFSANHYSKGYAWRWAEAASEAIAILYGQTVWMVQRESYRCNRNIIEVRKYGDTHELDYLSFFDPLSIEKEHFLKLADFFAQEETHAEICRNIFNQMSAASKQKTRPTQELLISTILEAALRSIDNHPFKEGDHSWKIWNSIESFRQNYLADEWRDSCDRALDARKHLRHRNAHPDWLFSEGGSMSDEEREKSLDDMIFLSKFYGYMILALAGFKELEPKFPKPHADWGAMFTVESNENSDQSLR